MAVGMGFQFRPGTDNFLESPSFEDEKKVLRALGLLSRESKSAVTIDRTRNKFVVCYQNPHGISHIRKMPCRLQRTCGTALKSHHLAKIKDPGVIKNLADQGKGTKRGIKLSCLMAG